MATATVTGVRMTSATVEVAFASAATAIPEHAMARPLTKGAPTLPVILDASFTARERFTARVRASDHLTIGDHTAEANPIRLSISDGRLRATDPRGVPCFSPRADTERGLNETLDDLRAVARARALLALEPGSTVLLAPSALSVIDDALAAWSLTDPDEAAH